MSSSKRMNYGVDDKPAAMTQDQLRNAIAHPCDVMRREGLTTVDYVEFISQ